MDPSWFSLTDKGGLGSYGFRSKVVLKKLWCGNEMKSKDPSVAIEALGGAIDGPEGPESQVEHRGSPDRKLQSSALICS